MPQQRYRHAIKAITINDEDKNTGNGKIWNRKDKAKEIDGVAMEAGVCACTIH